MEKGTGDQPHTAGLPPLSGRDSHTPELPQPGFKFLRQGAVELHHLPGAGVEEPQAHRVEALTLEAGNGLFGPVHRVPQDRMADVGHVDPDLMGAAGLQPALHIGKAGEPLQYLPMGYGGPAVCHHRHFLAVCGMSADGRVHSAGVLPEVSHHNALIDPGQRVVLELGRELLMGEIVFRRDDEARGVPVDPVDDSRPQLPADAGEAVPATMKPL